MGKRIFLFLVTNIVIVLTLSVLMSVFGIGQYITPYGLDIQALAVLCLVWGMGGSFISLQMSRWVAKRATGVKLIQGQTGQEELDWVYQTVSRLAQQANLPVPEVGVYDSSELNAFATGPSKKRSLVAISTGLLRSMRREEIEGVLAHEIAHIGNGDMVTMTLLQGIINAFVMFLARIIAYALFRSSNSRNSYMLQFMVIMVLQVMLGILGSLVTSWFSRYREFKADAEGAHLAGREKMIAALKRLMANNELVESHHESLATLKINGRRGWAMFFSTHPPLQQRISALEEVTS
jgi:heat shock protein HtpX